MTTPPDLPALLRLLQQTGVTVVPLGTSAGAAPVPGSAPPARRSRLNGTDWIERATDEQLRAEMCACRKTTALRKQLRAYSIDVLVKAQAGRELDYELLMSLVLQLSARNAAMLAITLDDVAHTKKEHKRVRNNSVAAWAARALQVAVGLLESPEPLAMTQSVRANKLVLLRLALACVLGMMTSADNPRIAPLIASVPSLLELKPAHLHVVRELMQRHQSHVAAAIIASAAEHA